MPRFLDLPRFVHLLGCQLRRVPDLFESDVHVRTDMYSALFYLLVYAHVSSVSVV